MIFILKYNCNSESVKVNCIFEGTPVNYFKLCYGCVQDKLCKSSCSYISHIVLRIIMIYFV